MSENKPKSISYSALCNYDRCGHLFKIVHVDKHKPRQIIENVFGTLIHKCTQNLLQKKLTTKQSAEKFVKTWNRFCSLYKIKEQKYLDLSIIGEKIIYYVESFLSKSFGKYTVEHVEYPIKQQLENVEQIYKGFIDLILKLENGRIIIIDIKTAMSSFIFNKYKDRFKEYQLVFYKKFYSDIEKIDREKIETYFLIFEKDKESKSIMSLSKISSGDKKISNAETWLNESLININKERYIKNFTACRMFGEKHICQFYNTELCKKFK